MKYRHSASMAACRLAVEARALTREIDGLVVNVGRMAFEPGNVNVIPRRAVMTLDVRNPSDDRLALAEAKIAAIVKQIEADEGVSIGAKDLARFPAQPFDERLITAVESAATGLGLPVRRMFSGAGHDAQMMATVTPTAMIFVPSVKGLSHTPLEFTRDEDVIAGCNVLLAAAVQLAGA